MDKMKGFVSLLILCGTVHGQSMGNGISKYTRGQSDPRSCLSFFESFMSANEMDDDCVPRGHCECGTQGRGSLGGERRMFGIHAINCSYHPYGQHSLADVEAMQTEEIDDFKNGYTEHLDSHLGVYVADLHATMEQLERNKVPHYGLTWQHADRRSNTSFYSVMVAPEGCGGFYIEFLSERASGVEMSKFHKTNEVRFDFGNYSRPTSDFHPIKVSRATTKMEEMIDFYTKVIRGQVIKRETVDGVDIAWLKLDSAPNMMIHFVNRPSSSSAKFTVKDLEDYVNSVHDEYIKNANCGFDQFADHHWAYDEMSRLETLSSVAKKCDAGGYKYRWFYIDEIQTTQMYVVDPSGWTFQLDAMPGNDVPRRIATYSAACKSNDGCSGQGLCDDVEVNPFEHF